MGSDVCKSNKRFGIDDYESCKQEMRSLKGDGIIRSCGSQRRVEIDLDRD